MQGAGYGNEDRYADVLREFYGSSRKKLVDGTERDIGFDCSVDAEQGRLLYDIVREYKPDATLEIGLAWGGSAIHILCGLEANGKGHHIALDPYQVDGWSSVGVSEPQRVGLGQYLTCLHERSDVMLPQFVKEKRSFQFAFIDGDHRFDSAFLDFYFCDRLLSVGGILMFDDAKAMSVGRVISFVDSNMPNLKRIHDDRSFNRFATFLKIDEDRRKTGDEAVF